MAYWYMDDGAAKWTGKSLGLRFCTDNYTRDECQQLVSLLGDKFGLECTLQKKGGGWRVYVRERSYERAKESFFPFIIPEMRHKFPS